MSQTPSPRPLPKSIALSLLFYRCLLGLGPAAFRRAYAESALLDFRQCCCDAYRQHRVWSVLRLWPGLLGETIVGLLAEYWLELFARRSPMLPRIRYSIITTFWAFVLFLLAYTVLARVADPVAPFNAVSSMHPEIGFAHSVVSMSGSIALLVLVLGGLPILFVALKHALPNGPRGVARLFVIRPKQALRLLGAALLLTIGSLGFLFTIQYLFSSQACTPANGCILGQPSFLIILSFAALIGGITLLYFVILAITASLSLAVMRSEFGTRMLRFVLVPIGLLATLMVSATVASSVWTIRLWVDAPQFAASSAGLGNGQTIEVIALIAAMAISAIVTTGAFVSGLRAERARIS